MRGGKARFLGDLVAVQGAFPKQIFGAGDAQGDQIIDRAAIAKEAAEIRLMEDVKVRVRLVDCVGYMVEGASGHMENGEERKVKTPWFEHEIPFTKAASVGTQKVIRDHATIGVVVTTDGSIGELPRAN